jgi:hypothetical protein
MYLQIMLAKSLLWSPGHMKLKKMLRKLYTYMLAQTMYKVGQILVLWSVLHAFWW